MAGQLRVNTQILDAQGGHTEVNEPGSKLDDADFLRLIDPHGEITSTRAIFSVLAGSDAAGLPAQELPQAMLNHQAPRLQADHRRAGRPAARGAPVRAGFRQAEHFRAG
ncbi:MAG: hypothetical protein ACLR4Z_13455 [Butyricicoccaceae bacterium]